MKRLFCCVLIGVLSWGGARTALADTIFSFNGVGDMVRRVDARSLAMGGAGRALVDGQNFSLNNPALLGAFVRSSVSAQYVAQHRALSTGGSLNDGDLGAFQVVLPVGHHSALGVGYVPLTVEDFGTVDSVGTGDLGYQLNVTATGGIQAIAIGWGQRIGERLFLGERIDWVAMGTIDETWIKSFNGANVYYSRDNIRRTHRGWIPSLGFVFTPTEHWSLGGDLQVGHSIRQHQILSTRFVAQGAARNIKTESQVKLPTLLGFGAVYMKSYRWLLAADVERGFWSKTGSGRFDTWDISAGGTLRTGSPDPMVISRRLEYNAGVHYRSLYFPTASGSQIGEWGASLGLALPLKHNSGRFRYMIEIGKRGDQAKQGTSERFIRQSFSITGIFQ